MPYKNKFIAPFQIGMENDVDAWLIPDNSFSDLRNMYLYRGRLRKKFGYSYLGRLLIELKASALGNFTIPSGPINIFAILGLPATSTIIPGSVLVFHAGLINIFEDVPSDGNLYLAGVPSGTIDYGTGIITLDLPNPTALGAVSISCIIAKGLPVMGLPNRELTALNFEELLAFDTQDAYVWNTVANQFNLITPAIGWTGTDSDFFWCTNYWKTGANNLLWVTNNTAADRIRYYQGGGFGGWTTIVPQLNNLGVGFRRYLYTCLILIPYRNRLVALNTTEYDENGAVTTNYQSRARWCGIADPTVALNWDDTTPGLGNYIDAPTNERIITAKFVKDTLVVGFERSTWILKYTFDYTTPFIWERVHSELGCESTFSSVVFDNFMLQVGFRGINAANGYSSERIDMKVPYLVQNIQNDHEGNKRVYGIRDFNNQMVYWTYSDQQLDNGSTYPKIYPESIIAYNYYEQAFSTYDASFTCFGYYQPANDLTWAGAGHLKWEDINFSWNSGQTQAGFPSIVAGNQVGFVHQLRDTTANDISVFITNITQALPALVTAPNHNFQNGQCIKITDVLGMTEVNNNNYFVANATANTFTLQEYNTTTGVLDNVDSIGYTAYIGYGLITTIDNITILTKQYNPFEIDDVKVRNGFTEFLISTTTSGEITADILIDQNISTSINTLTLETSNQPLPPLASSKEWKRIYFNTVGNYLQFKLYMSLAQMHDDTKNVANIELHAMNLAVEEAGRRQSFS